MSIKHALRLACAAAISTVAANAGAVAPADLGAQLDGLIAQQLVIGATEFVALPTGAEKEELLEMLAADPRVIVASTLTAELVAQVTYENVVRPRTTVDEARSLYTHYTENMGSVPSPKVVSHLVQLALPYAIDAGLCTGDAMSAAGLTCAFAFAPAGAPIASVSGTIGDGLAATAIPNVDPGSLLYEVLSGCAPEDDACRQLAAPLLSDESAQAATPANRTLYSRLREFQYDRLLSLIGIGTASAQSYSWVRSEYLRGERSLSYMGLQARLATGLGYWMKLRCGVWSGLTCDLWGEASLAGNLKYLVSDSDMLLAVVPFAFHCNRSCTYSGAGSYALSVANDKWLGGSATFDPVQFAMSNADSVQLRNAGSYAQLKARGACGVVPLPYQTRPGYEAYKAFTSTMPYAEYFDLSPHTSFQVPTTDPLTPLLSTNMDPTPTRAVAKLPPVSCNPLPISIDFVWTYNFLLVSSWNFNVIFSGFQNVNPINYCGADQIWVWHGAPGTGSKGLPMLHWTFDFAGGHPPYLI